MDHAKSGPLIGKRKVAYGKYALTSGRNTGKGNLNEITIIQNLGKVIKSFNFALVSVVSYKVMYSDC